MSGYVCRHRMSARNRATAIAAVACAAVFTFLGGVTVRQDGFGLGAALLLGAGALFLLFANWYAPKAFATWEVRVDDAGIGVTRLWWRPRTWHIAAGHLWQYVIDGTSEGEGWLTLVSTDGRRIRAPIGMTDAEALAAALDSAS